MVEGGQTCDRRLVIHAGLGKSGSSAIQKYLRDSAGDLRCADACYLGMYLERGDPLSGAFASADDLQRALSDDPAIEDRLVALLTQRIQGRPGIKTFIWSHIGLAVSAPLMARVIARLTPICKTEVVLYFRHQASWLVSAYLQWGVKHKANTGPIRSFSEWLPEARSRGADYRQVIESWREAIAPQDLHVRSYDLAADVVTDFLTTMGLPIPPASDRSNWHYQTPDAAVLTLYRLYQGQNDAEAPPGVLQRALAASGVEKKRYREVDPASTLPAGLEWTNFVERFEADNAALARDFGLILNAPSRGPAQDPQHAAPAVVIPALLDMIIAMERRIAALEKRLKAPDESIS
ncbi:hypothetical protein [Sphingomonas mucosissima]|uniref:Sulfotransferase family protein n=1 Tax=Sphingomonas mucosissima TaxID=370959 RepID=A0A245ZSB3_9SPHN|nr:hypothetical protein [Sphingomonas mucosissima]OWK32637.1 hypothetical protein SPMU_09750 [Sphingomonas mucosissima]